MSCVSGSGWTDFTLAHLRPSLLTNLWLISYKVLWLFIGVTRTSVFFCNPLSLPLCQTFWRGEQCYKVETQDSFTDQYYSTCKSSCMLSPVALVDLIQACWSNWKDQQSCLDLDFETSFLCNTKDCIVDWGHAVVRTLNWQGGCGEEVILGRLMGIIVSAVYGVDPYWRLRIRKSINLLYRFQSFYALNLCLATHPAS